MENDVNRVMENASKKAAEQSTSTAAAATPTTGSVGSDIIVLQARSTHFGGTTKFKVKKVLFVIVYSITIISNPREIIIVRHVDR